LTIRGEEALKTQNTSIQNFIKYVEGKNLIIYGLGKDYEIFADNYLFPSISKHICAYIDNGKAGQEMVSGEQTYIVKSADYLKTISQGIILICSSKYMDEMYQSLCQMNLPDGIECFFLPLIWTVSDGIDDDAIKKRFWGSSLPDKIEKKIHCFWFSGEEKPENYARCIDSWKQVCPDYEIVEWTADTYDCGKNTFVKQAYDLKKWAFVSDYARLDVIYHYGGIYLDMDVELKKDFEPLLKTSAFFSFGGQFSIDMGSGFGSAAHNPFIKLLLEQYDGKSFLDEAGTPMMEAYLQPLFLKEIFIQKGLHMNGNMQLIDDMLFLPRKYYTPVDDFFLQNYAQCEDTRGIHWFNAGWWGDDFRARREKYKMWIEISKKMI
jgi:hypothetical protein